MSIRDVWEKMIEEKLLVPNGEVRRNSKGEFEPVYVLSEKGKIKYADMLARMSGAEKGGNA
jgi:hypothetical protein